MKCVCEMCGAYTKDKKEIEEVLKNNTCPVCLFTDCLKIKKGGVSDA